MFAFTFFYSFNSICALFQDLLTLLHEFLLLFLSNQVLVPLRLNFISLRPNPFLCIQVHQDLKLMTFYCIFFIIVFAIIIIRVRNNFNSCFLWFLLLELA